MSAPEQPTVLFVADAHFHLEPDAAEQRRVARFLEFLRVAERADDLVMLGDIFDFWFDYPHFRLKGYDNLLSGLDAVKAAGTRLHFVGGNHDVWATEYLHRRYGVAPCGDRRVMEFGAQRVLLDHGDGLIGRDWAYRAFRAVVRNRLGIVVAKSLHPEVLYTLSTWLSGRSRGATRDEAARIVDKARRWLEKQDGAPWDLMVMGHVHHPFELTAGPRRMAALAGWFDTLGYGLLRAGRFRLLDFADGQDPLAT